MPEMSRLALLAMLVITASAAHAQRPIYKCIENGAVVYSERPVCAEAAPNRDRRTTSGVPVDRGGSADADLPPPGVNMAAEIQAEFERERAERERNNPKPLPAKKASTDDSWAQYEREECMAEMKRRPVVFNSAWDGSVHQVEQYLKRHYLRDPTSYESIGWTKVERHCNGYRVIGKYRARNGFGGMNVESAIFELDRSGNVIKMIK